MYVDRVQNSNNCRMNFGGIIPKTKLFKNVEETAIGMIRHNDSRRNQAFAFYNTIKAMKSDGTNNYLSIKPFPPNNHYHAEYYTDRCIVKYGDLEKISLSKDNVIDVVIEFGKKLFGDKIIYAKPKGLGKVLNLQKKADNFHQTLTEIEKYLGRKYDAKQSRVYDKFEEAFGVLLQPLPKRRGRNNQNVR